jgi:hypothetical protein
MKNIHVLPTDKPSRLRYNLSNVLALTKEPYRDYSKQVNQNIYITSDSEIKKGDWIYLQGLNKVIKCVNIIDGLLKAQNAKKVILTTDQDLDGVQAIDDEFLEWFVNNPSCEYVVVKYQYWKEINDVGKYTYKIIIPKEELTKCYCGHTTTCDCGPEEPKYTTSNLDNEKYKDYSVSKEEPKQEFLLFDKERADTITSEGQKTVRELQNTIQQETLEEAAEKEYDDNLFDYEKYRDGFIKGAKWQQEKIYEIMDLYADDVMGGCTLRAKEWFEQFKKK